MVWKYWAEIYSKSREEIRELFGLKWEVFKLLLVFLVVVISLYRWYGFGFAFNIVIRELWIEFTTIPILFLFTPIIAFFNMFRVAANRDDFQQRKLSLKEYDDIEVVSYEYPWTSHEQRLGMTGFYNFMKVGILVVNNGGASVSNCLARMMDVNYKGYASNDEWVENPNQVEIKPLNWEEGYEPDNGRISINSGGGTGKILLAETMPHDPKFNFVFVDGPSKSYQHLVGRYKVFVQLEGQVQREDMIVDLDPIKFEIEFDYKNRRLLDVTVYKRPKYEDGTT